MLFRFNIFKFVLVFILSFVLAGCSTIGGWFDTALPDKREIDYKTSRKEKVKPLEVPPDLTQPNKDDGMLVPDISPSGTATYSDYSGERKDARTPANNQVAVLPEQDDFQVKRDERTTWLELRGDPTQVWPKIRDFWLQNGFLLSVDNPALGIMETDWAENRANIPEGPVRSFISKAFDSLYSSGTRDKFRIRLETGVEEGTTELFIAHRGMEEELTGSDKETSLWVHRPSDPDLEATMLRRMMLFIGVEQKKVDRQFARQESRKPRATIIKTDAGEVTLLVNANFSRTWRLAGLALDRVGFAVEDRDRSKGTYFVRYNDPNKGEKKKGFLSNLAFWSSDEKKVEDTYQVKINSQGRASSINILDKTGNPEKSDTSQRILNLLYEQLK